ncbi:hypothetical protein CBR_g28565 [Chara braunii]|uniref:Uncharacterized protein n=1 Tax=Chara braunii TaxID=69332 RepID=A0A388JWB0_CHABU|nr:hypothetical protein CBR_g28565 [Chara braunii]|eukprot:GBG62089.1 hypothetical protein CBR_g28565 [Chara braunii]
MDQSAPQGRTQQVPQIVRQNSLPITRNVLPSQPCTSRKLDTVSQQKAHVTGRPSPISIPSAGPQQCAAGGKEKEAVVNGRDGRQEQGGRHGMAASSFSPTSPSPTSLRSTATTSWARRRSTGCTSRPLARTNSTDSVQGRNKKVQAEAQKKASKSDSRRGADNSMRESLDTFRLSASSATSSNSADTTLDVMSGQSLQNRSTGSSCGAQEGEVKVLAGATQEEEELSVTAHNTFEHVEDCDVVMLVETLSLGSKDDNDQNVSSSDGSGTWRSSARSGNVMEDKNKCGGEGRREEDEHEDADYVATENNGSVISDWHAGNQDDGDRGRLRQKAPRKVEPVRSRAPGETGKRRRWV